MTTFKRGRCKFCRSRAKYLPGQRSFDASKIFGRRRERGEPRRAASEDQNREDERQQSFDGKGFLPQAREKYMRTKNTHVTKIIRNQPKTDINLSEIV